jgi:hypothetical protein
VKELLAVFSLCLTATSEPVLAEESGALSYFCNVEASGGVSYNANTQRWVGTTFRPEGKFVLRLHFLKERVIKNEIVKDETVKDYTATLTNAGSKYARPCAKSGAVDPTVTVFERGQLYCTDGTTDYSFSIQTNRFLASYLVGFVGGEDNNDNTPSISAGTCTKIE